MGEIKRKTLESGDADVERYNALRITKAVRSPRNKFALAERLCREGPRICDPNRDRVLVEVTTLDAKGKAGVRRDPMNRTIIH